MLDSKGTQWGDAMRIRSHTILYLLFFGLGMMPAFAESSQVQLNALAAARFLEQATWGPTQAAVAHLQQSWFRSLVGRTGGGSDVAYS